MNEFEKKVFDILKTNVENMTDEIIDFVVLFRGYFNEPETQYVQLEENLNYLEDLAFNKREGIYYFPLIEGEFCNIEPEVVILGIDLENLGLEKTANTIYNIFLGWDCTNCCNAISEIKVYKIYNKPYIQIKIQAGRTYHS